MYDLPRIMAPAIGDPGSDEVRHSSAADPERMGADEEHSSPLISTDQTMKETASTHAVSTNALVFGISVN